MCLEDAGTSSVEDSMKDRNGKGDKATGVVNPPGRPGCMRCRLICLLFLQHMEASRSAHIPESHLQHTEYGMLSAVPKDD